MAHPVFKTGRAEQPSAWKVRFLRRSVTNSAVLGRFLCRCSGEALGVRVWETTDPTPAAVVGAFAAVSVLRFATDDPANGAVFLYVVPISLVAVRYGVTPALFTAAFALAVFAAWDLTNDASVSWLGYVTRATAFTVAAGAMSAAIWALWKQERRAEARKIHDGLVQDLTVARYSAQAGDIPQCVEALDRSLNSAQEIVGRSK